MVKKKNRPIGFWERTFTAIAITFLVLGYYRMLSKAHAAPYELFHQEVFDHELDELFQLKKNRDFRNVISSFGRLYYLLLNYR